MESVDSGVTSPVLRVTAEITELKGNPSSRDHGKYNISPSVASKDGRPNLFNRKKILNPLYGHNPYQRSNYAGSYISSQQNPRNNVSQFTQRVMSAKLLRTKQLQNQLAETQMKLNEVLHENKILRTLQLRQDSVLKKYEGHQEQLPQLLKSHHEEIRILNEKYKQIRASYRELEIKMKQKDNELTNLREQYKHLLKLARDKHLGDREKLTQKVEEMESIIEQQKNKIHNLDKKLQIEEKTHRHQLNQEIIKFRKAQSELNSALETISNLKATIEAKDRFATSSYPRFQQSAPSQAKASHVSLPAPPRVSIRQTQRLAHSASALQQEDSETAESFTINYSPGEPGSSSLDSDNLSTGSKEENRNVNIHQENEGNSRLQIEGNSRLQGLIPGGIHITKEAFKERRALRRTSVEKESKPIKLKDKKNDKSETTNRRKSLKDSSSKENISTEINKRKDSQQNYENLEIQPKSNTEEIPVVSSDNIGNEKTAPENNLGPFSHLQTDEDKLFTEIEKEINSQELSMGNNMKIDMDEEFEKFLESTKMSDETISEYFRRDFRAEINEIEKKFQDLDKASERYMSMNKKINGTSLHIPLTGEIDSDEEEEITFENQNGEKDEILEFFDNSEIHKRSNGPILGESQKASLLKALNHIDKSSVTEKEENEEHADDLPLVKDKVNSTIPISTFSRTNRRSLVMKDLFGGEGTKL